MLDLCEVDVALKAYGEMIRSVELHLNRQHHMMRAVDDTNRFQS